MRVCVTGAAGYLGSVLCPMLLQAGHEVVAVDNLLYRQTSLLDCCAYKGFEFWRGDVRDTELMIKLAEDCDVVIWLAAIVGAPACDRNLEAWAINYEAMRSATVVGFGRDHIMLFPTTNSGYGVGGKEYCNEESPLNPLTRYGRSKVSAEQIVLSQSNSVSFRLATLFGMSPRMRLDLLVNDFVYRAMRDKYVVLYQAHFRRNYLHVRDAASAFLWAIDHFDEMKGRAYNVGLPDANLTKRELCERIKRHVPDFYFCEATVGEDVDKRDYIISNERILATGWRPRYSLDDGIRELIKGYEILKGERFGNV